MFSGPKGEKRGNETDDAVCPCVVFSEPSPSYVSGSGD